MERLGDLDRKILALLQRDGRRSFADIGREVGLSTPAVKRRVDRMEEAGVIRGYAAVVDPSRLGLGFEAIAEVYCADRTAPHDVLASVEGIPEVVSAVTVSGEPDAVLRVQVDDIRHLERLIETLRRRPNVVRTRTMIVLSVLVDRPTRCRVASPQVIVPYDDFGFGFSWLPDEAMTRTSHALDTGDGVWLVDPVDVPEALERAAALGAAGGRAPAARPPQPRLRGDRGAARRPAPAPARRDPRQPVRGRAGPRASRGWREIALWWPERRVLVVAELIGTTADPRARRRPRPACIRCSGSRPPGALRGYEPEHLLVGHGRGVHGPAAAEALSGAYSRARTDLPRLVGRVPTMAKAALAARRPT